MPLVDDAYFEILDSEPRRRRQRRRTRTLEPNPTTEVLFYVDNTVFQLGWDGDAATLPPGRRRPARPRRVSTADSRIYPVEEDADKILTWNLTEDAPPAGYRASRRPRPRRADSDRLEFRIDDEALFVNSWPSDDRRWRRARVPHAPDAQPNERDWLLTETVWDMFDVGQRRRAKHTRRPDDTPVVYDAGLVNDVLVWIGDHEHHGRRLPRRRHGQPGDLGYDVAGETVDVQPADVSPWLTFDVGRSFRRGKPRRPDDQLAFYDDDPAVTAARLIWAGEMPRPTRRRPRGPRKDTDERPHEQDSLASDQVAEITVRACSMEAGRIRRLPRPPREAAETGIVSISELVLDALRPFDDQPGRPRRARTRRPVDEENPQLANNSAPTATGPYYVVAGEIYVAGAVAGEVET